MNEADLAYVAGIIDGEGYIAITKFPDKKCRVGYHYALKVVVGMGNPIVPKWLQASFGGSFGTYKPYRAGYKERHIWQVTTAQAGHFLELILPYLKEKTEQARIAIEFQAEKVKHWNKYNRRLGKPIIAVEAEGLMAKRISELNKGA